MRREHMRFALEPGHTFGIFGEALRQRLDRDFAIERFVDGFVDRAGTAASERRNNPVLADGRAKHDGRVTSCGRGD